MKHFIGYLALTLAPLLVIPVAGCGGRDSAALVARGTARLEAGDYAAAARAFKRASRLIHDSAPLSYNLGTACFHLDNLDAAEEAFEAARRIDPGHLAAAEMLARTWSRQGRHAEAIDLLLPLSDTAPREARPRLLNALALVEQRTNRIDLAVLHLIQATRLAPRYAPSYYNLGSLLADAYQLYAEATDPFELFTRLADDDDPRLERAREKLLQLKAAAPGGGGASHDRPARPAAAVQQAIREGDQHYKARKWGPAEAAFARALTADPLNFDAALRLGHARLGGGNPAAAVKAYQRAGELAPSQVEPVYLQALAAYTAGNLDQAAQILTSLAIPRWPAHAPHYQLMAYVRAAQRRIDEAMIYGRYYLELMPGTDRGLDPFRAWLDALGN